MLSLHEKQSRLQNPATVLKAGPQADCPETLCKNMIGQSSSYSHLEESSEKPGHRLPTNELVFLWSQSYRGEELGRKKTRQVDNGRCQEPQSEESK